MTLTPAIVDVPAVQPVPEFSGRCSLSHSRRLMRDLDDTRLLGEQATNGAFTEEPEL
jgi:hypothetical protein